LNGQKKSASPLLSDETQKLIEQLQAQAKHAEEHGNFDSAHHEMLRKLLAANDVKEIKETRETKEKKEIDDDGKQDL